MLRRKIEDALLRWKGSKGTQGLLVTGARQVGKTSSIERFGATHYGHTIKIDFVERPEAVELIGGATSLDDLVMRITALARNPLGTGKTLLFFDEVQRCGDAITWMRYLASDERFDVIYSGSLLGVEAYDFRSFPVGTIDIVEMFPLDFEEFSWGMGADPALWETVRSCFEARRAVPEAIHKRLMDLYVLYVLVGGMPNAVQTYASTSDTQAMRLRQKAILAAYRTDITRYVSDRTHAQRIKTIYDAMPAQLNKENRRFIVSGMDKRRRFEHMQSDFDWLASAGVALPVKRANEALFPLGLNREDSHFKFFLNDVGLLFSTFTPADVVAILSRRDYLNFGQAFENAVAQELRAQGREQLFYFNATKVGEVDFLVEDRQTPSVIPIEVKSGKYSTRHAGLDNLLSVKNFDIQQAIVLHMRNVEEKGRILYLPIYMTGLL